jgi:hypothetical protein
MAPFVFFLEVAICYTAELYVFLLLSLFTVIDIAERAKILFP